MLKPLHTGISVSNLEASIDWYRDVLGFELVFKKDFEMLKSHIAFIRLGDFEIELFEHYDSKELPEERRMPMEDIKTQGTKHICFETSDIETLYEGFRNKDVDIVIGPAPMENDAMGFIRDPSGVLIEFIQHN